MHFLDSIFTILFPARCISCKADGTDLCSECLGSCREAERECAEWVFPLYDYRDPTIKKAIWLMKYKGKRRLAGIFGEVMHPRVLEELADRIQLENFQNPLLVPIPLSTKRYRERGFNQAELICKKLIETDQGKNFETESSALIRIKDTEHQARIENRAERLKNIVGSFAVKNNEKIKNRNIILIDDVTTTGATLAEARKVLKQSGAKKVIAFTVAH